VEPLQELAACDRLLAEHLAVAVERFGAAALGVIDLPPLPEGSVDPASVRAAAALFWAKHVEMAGLLLFAERLVDGVAKGTLLLPVSHASTELGRYKRALRDHLTYSERLALYDRVFDGEFDTQFSHLVEALSSMGRSAVGQGVPQHRAQIAIVGRNLAELLSSRMIGILAFAARDITQSIRLAIEILQHPEVKRALGGLGLWTTLELHGNEVVGHALEPMTATTLAGAGRRLLEWLADTLPTLNDSSLGSYSAAIAEAETWKATSGK
jgi:hypothetical protein